MATDLILVPQICLNMPKQYYAPAKVGRLGLPEIKRYNYGSKNKDIAFAYYKKASRQI
jgi:hypothetical protein